MHVDEWYGAPEWAKFKASDADGKTYWYEREPRLRGRQWDHPMSEPIGKIQIVHPPVLVQWQESLISR